MRPLRSGVSADNSRHFQQRSEAHQCAADDDQPDSPALGVGVFIFVGQQQAQNAADDQHSADVKRNLDDDVGDAAEKHIQIHIGVDGGQDNGIDPRFPKCGVYLLE